jgi:hypothetical protein
MDVLLNLLGILLVAAILVGFVALIICWMLYDNLLNFPALLREAMRPTLTHQQRVRITGGYFAGFVGTLLERDDANYRVDIDSVGRTKIAIRHLRPLLAPALPAPKEPGEECASEYPALLSPDEPLRDGL